jgi:hypothetical protein
LPVWSGAWYVDATGSLKSLGCIYLAMAAETTQARV